MSGLLPFSKVSVYVAQARAVFTSGISIELGLALCMWNYDSWPPKKPVYAQYWLLWCFLHMGFELPFCDSSLSPSWLLLAAGVLPSDIAVPGWGGVGCTTPAGPALAQPVCLFHLKSKQCLAALYCGTFVLALPKRIRPQTCNLR